MSVAPIPVITNSFNGGELSQLMHGRSDTKLYAIGAERMENFCPMVEGPMQKRPGFRRIRPAAASAIWLERFIFSNTQSYVIEGSEGKARFYTNGVRIEGGPTTPYEVAVPYGASEWPELSVQQSYERLYMAHGNHAPAALRRTGAATFAHETLALSNGPIKDGNSDQAATVTVTGDLTVGGVVTISASQAIFQAGHVGGLFQVEAQDFSSIPAWQVGIAGVVAGTTKWRSDGKVYLAATSGRSGTIAPIHEEGSEWDGDASSTAKDINDKGPYGVKWTYLHDRFGLLRITGFTNATTVTATVVRRVPDSLASVASWRWSHGAFSAAEGWPNLVFVWAGRLCFLQGFWLYASVAGDYFNFQQFTSSGFLAADLAFRLRLSAENPPLWVMVDRDVVIGTASHEYVIGAVNPQAGVTGENISAKKQSAYGSMPVRPIEPGQSLIFVQRGGRKLREAEYDFGRDRYVSSNINRWARHIAGPGQGVIQLGFQAESEELVFAVRSDGQLVLRTYDPEQEVKGFCRCEIAQGGKVLSAVAIPSEDGTRDEIWALIDWDGARSVQQMAPWWDFETFTPEGAFFVDDGLSLVVDPEDPPVSSVTALHLAGKPAWVLADGAVLPPIASVGADGVITLPSPARQVHVGRGYSAFFTALRPELRDGKGDTVQGRLKRLVKLGLRLLMTGAMKADAGDGRLENLIKRSTSDRMDIAVPLFTGDTDATAVGGQWDRDGRYSLVSDDPRPSFVIATMPRYQVGDQ